MQFISYHAFLGCSSKLTVGLWICSRNTEGSAAQGAALTMNFAAARMTSRNTEGAEIQPHCQDV
jgi:hypothetical protein